MFTQLMFVRLRAAEKALREGRLDEAHRLAGASDLREHRRAKAVLKELSSELLQRAREHYRADRFEEALHDCDRAEVGGEYLDEIKQLRADIHTVAAELKRDEQSRHRRLEDARRRMERGSLQAGRRILGDADEADHEAARLQDRLKHQAEEASYLISQAEKLIANNQWSSAAERIRRAKAVDAHNEELAKVESGLCEKVITSARSALHEGKPRRASDELDCLGELGASLPARKELARILSLVSQAASDVAAGRYASARSHVMSLSRLLPKAKWVRESCKQIESLDDVLAAFRAGPLGDLIANVTEAEVEPIPASMAETVRVPLRAKPLPVAQPVDHLLLLVDGGGSYLIIQSPQCSIGRVVSSKPADVPIFGDLGEQHATITRTDDDYFLASEKDVEVSGVKARRRLLQDGDRVVLGRKAKFTFCSPSRRSSTAVLDLSETTKMPNDVRRVVLLSHHATIGAGRGAHIRCPHVSVPLVLFERDGKLFVRAHNNGHVDVSPKEVKLGEPMEMLGASFVLQRWQVRPIGSSSL